MSSKRPKVYIENVSSYLTGVSNKTYKAMKKQFSISVDFHELKARRFNGPKRKYFIQRDRKTGEIYFLTGLIQQILGFVEYMEGQQVEVYDNRGDLTLPDFGEIKARLKSLPVWDTIRPYQFEALLEGLQTPLGYFNMATGAGKTVVMISLLTCWDRKSLILVDKKDLADQIVEELQWFLGLDKKDIGVMYGGNWRDRHVNVGLVQTLGRNNKKGKKKKFLESVEALFVDECHHISGNSYKNTIKKMKNCSIRYGFSATPFGKEKRSVRSITTPNGRTKYISGPTFYDNYSLEGWLGEELYAYTTQDLIRDGWLATLRTLIVHNDLGVDGAVLLNYADEYRKRIVENKNRNKIIASIIAESYNNGLQTLGFVSRIDHGEEISNLLQNRYNIPKSHIGYVTGESEKTYRKDSIDDFKLGELPILFGTVLGEGLNFYADVGINIEAGKARTGVYQKKGRLLRKPRDPERGDVDPNDYREVLYFDFKDKNGGYFTHHSVERCKIYEKEGHFIDDPVYISQEEALEKIREKAGG